MATWYANIDNAYAAIGVDHFGTEADPFDDNEIKSILSNSFPWWGWVGPFPSGDIFLISGFYDLQGTGMWDNMGLGGNASTDYVFRPNGNAFPRHRALGGAADESFQFNAAAGPDKNIFVESVIFSGCLYQGSSVATDDTYTVRNSLFHDGIWIQHTINNANYLFYGCSVARSNIDITASAGRVNGDVEFEYCYLEECTLETSANWVAGGNTLTFRNCLFTNTQAQFEAALAPGTVIVYIDCIFNHGVTVALPAFLAETESNLNYYQYGLPVIVTDALWSANDYNMGFFGSSRQGYGAFVFDADFAFTATPTSGYAPLEVVFTPDVVNSDLEYGWDFGDGHTSDEISPRHTYDMPGEYVVTLTMSFPGETITGTQTIYVYESDYSAGGRNVTKTTRIYRFGIPQEKKQGIGWSEYSGTDYPNAIGLVGTCKLFNNEDEERVIVTDCNTFKHYWLGKEDHWRDGGNDDYAGAEIDSDILLREHVPPIESTAKIRHSESEADFRPWYKDRRNTGDYNRFGFRNAFRSSMYFREDHSPEDRAEVRYFPRHAQIVSDRHIEAESLQAGLRITGAPWRLPSVQQYFEQIDTAAAPPEKQMSEKTWAEAIADSLVWIGRSIELVDLDTGAHIMPWDKGSNQRTTGSFAGVIPGPDGNARSGIVFAAADSMVTNVAVPQGDMSIIMWVRSPAGAILAADTLTVSIVGNDLVWTDGVDNLTIPLSMALTEWVMITIVRHGNILEIYENGVLANTRFLTRNVGYAAPITFYGGTASGFEPRMISNNISADVVRWMYDDVIENNGNSTCAMY